MSSKGHAATGLACAALAASVLAVPISWWPTVATSLLLVLLLGWLALVLVTVRRAGASDLS